MVVASAVLTAGDLDTTGENIKEDVSDMITQIDPYETPCQANFGTGKTGSDYFEWLEKPLATAIANNRHADGDDFGTTVTGDTTTAANRNGNFAQISKKQIKVSGRAQQADKYGRALEMNRQKLDKSLELRRDMEMSITDNSAGSGAATQVTAGLPAWMRTNVQAGTGAAADPTLSSTTYGYPNAARTRGTVQALSEADIRDVMKEAYINGGNPSIMMMEPTVKSLWSQFMIGSGKVATPYQDHGKNPRAGVHAVGAVDVFISDFGVYDVIPNRFQSPLDVFILEPDLWDIVYFKGRKFLIEELGKAGDNDREHVLSDYGVKCRSEKGNGIVTDIDSTTPMVA